MLFLIWHKKKKIDYNLIEKNIKKTSEMQSDDLFEIKIVTLGDAGKQ